MFWGPLPDDAPDEATLWFVAGLVTFADWLGSNEDLFPQDAEWDFEERRSHARQALDYVGWKPVKLRGELLFGDLFPGYIANPLQFAATQKIEDPGLYIIEGPMGSGKTEAALAAAYQLIENGKANGIYFALPTQVTSNRIYLRMRTFLQTICAEAAEFRLAHSASWLAQTDEPPNLSPASPDAEAKEHIHAGRSWFASPKRRDSGSKSKKAAPNRTPAAKATIKCSRSRNRKAKSPPRSVDRKVTAAKSSVVMMNSLLTRKMARSSSRRRAPSV